jgi:hypothetical protein
MHVSGQACLQLELDRNVWLRLFVVESTCTGVVRLVYIPDDRAPGTHLIRARLDAVE